MKHKNSDLVPKIFLSVVGVILVGVIIYYVMNSVQGTTRLADSILLGTEKTASEYAEYDIVKYDGEEIRGSEVVNFIKKHLGDYDTTEEAPIYVKVIKKAPGSTNPKTYKNKKHVSDINNFSNMDHYIKPTAIFKGEVIRNTNKVILGVEFTQK